MAPRKFRLREIRGVGEEANPETAKSSVNTHSAEAHIGMKNPQAFRNVSGREHGE